MSEIEDAGIQKRNLVEVVMRLDDNLLSFLCGIISNIPITLAFSVISIGHDVYEILEFSFTIVAFLLSALFTVEVFSLTLRKLSIQKKIDEKRGRVDKETEFQSLLEKHKVFFVRKLIVIAVLAILLIGTVVCLWVFPNFVVHE